MALKRKSNVVSMFNQKDAEELAKEYNDLSIKIKELEKRKKELSEKLKKCASQLGVTDDKGSSYIDGEYFVVGQVAKHSVKINQEEGVSFLRKKGLLNCIDEKTVYTVNETEVEKAVSNGELTEEEVRKFTSVSTSYSVSVKAKSEMPEVEVSAVARKKK